MILRRILKVVFFIESGFPASEKHPYERKLFRRRVKRPDSLLVISSFQAVTFDFSPQRYPVDAKSFGGHRLIPSCFGQHPLYVFDLLFL